MRSLAAVGVHKHSKGDAAPIIAQKGPDIYALQPIPVKTLCLHAQQYVQGARPTCTAQALAEKCIE